MKEKGGNKMKNIKNEKALLIQHTKIFWLKECRGAPYSCQRNQLQKSWLLPHSFFEYHSQTFPIHFQYIIQTKKGFQEKINQLLFAKEQQPMKVANLELTKKEDCYEIHFKYTPNAGNPERLILRDRKTKFELSSNIYSTMLHEKAFILYENEYGQVLYNGRFTDYDTGQWYYELNSINLIYIDKNYKSIDIFVKKNPTKTYTQIAHLF